MLYVVILFLLVSVFLYCLLGGADFGAGIIEFTSKKDDKKKIRGLISDSMGPIWEANHMWLIITVVILFNAFPEIYSQISISLYIPLILLLIGIILRGCAFTFRHYDAIKDKSQEAYSKVFEYSSLMVTFFLGLIIGALISGKIELNPQNYFDSYMFPWLNLFSISIGIFLCALFTFIASTYLIGDSTEEEIRKLFIRKSKKSTVTLVITGGFVFLSSYIAKVDFAEKFFSHPVSILLIIIATAALPLLWKYLHKGFIWHSRLLAGAQLLFIIGAFYAVYFPEIVRFKDSPNLTLYNSAAPEITLNYLGWALIVGSFIIFPSIFYLFKIFKLKTN